jgi:hypothetical protein
MLTRPPCTRPHSHTPPQAWLAGGQWHCLLPPGHAGLPEVKWCANRFMPFLVVAPQRDTNPGSRDAEEAGMEVGRGCARGARARP